MDPVTIAVVGIAIGVVTAIGTTVYAVRASRSRPRPHFTFANVAPADLKLHVSVDNPGGDAQKCSSVAHVGRDFYEFRGGIASGVQAAQLSMDRIGDKLAAPGSAVPIVLWIAAKDGRGKWWDVQLGRRIYGRIDLWLEKRSKQAGLPVPVQMEPLL